MIALAVSGAIVKYSWMPCTSLEEVADFLRHRVDRSHAVEHLAEGPAKALVSSVEQWTKHKKPRTELSAAIQIRSEL
jgi:hypothetical protein